MSGCTLYAALLACSWVASSNADEPPVVNPFAPRSVVRDDAIPGYIEMSSGAIITGHLHTTRDARLKIYDSQLQRQREIPWDRIQSIESHVQREWLEREWRFRENASDQKVFTGRKYPARIYTHTVTLNDGRQISGPLSAIVYVQPADGNGQKFVLYKRHKGEPGYDLKSLRFVKKVCLGQAAKQKGDRQAAERAPDQN